MGLDLQHLLDTYGYWAVLVCVGIQCAGVPFPGGAMLLTAAAYAGTSHRLNIVVIIAAAAAGNFLGGLIGYRIGRATGFDLVRRYGRYIRLNEDRLKLGVYAFRRYGSPLVVFGHFFSFTRTWLALLAGTHDMARRRFFALA